MASTFRYLSEYLALRAMAAVLNRLPYRAALVLGWLNAAVFFRLARHRAREAKKRIRQVFGSRLNRRAIDRIAWVAWRNLVFNGIDMIRLPHITETWAARYADYSGYVAALKQHLATGRGAIVAIPHMGSWELGPVLSRWQGIPLFSIEAKQRNPFVNAYIHTLRQSPGVPILERGSHTLREVLTRLRAGEVLGLLPDVRIPTPGVRVPFLGGEANLGRGMGLFAFHAGVPVFPAIVLREGWTRHRARVINPILPDPNRPEHDEIERITRAVMEQIESAIRSHPEQWFWYNKRWILDPVSVRDDAASSSSATVHAAPR